MKNETTDKELEIITNTINDMLEGVEQIPGITNEAIAKRLQEYYHQVAVNDVKRIMEKPEKGAIAYFFYRTFIGAYVCGFTDHHLQTMGDEFKRRATEVIKQKFGGN